MRRVVAVAQQHVLVRLQGGLGQRQRALGVERVDVGARDGQLGHPRVELVDVDALGLEVHRRQPQRVGADAQVDVLGDEDGRLVLVRVAHVQRDHQDQVVGDLALAQRRRHRTRRRGDPHLAAAFGQRDAVGQTPAVRAQAVEHPRHLARVPPELGRLLLEGVDLLEDEDRDDDFVVRELEDRAGIVKQNVRVENEMFHSELIISTWSWACRARSSPSS